jgi:hypothetical protein
LLIKASGKQTGADKDMIYCWPDSFLDSTPWPTGVLLLAGEIKVTNDA